MISKEQLAGIAKKTGLPLYQQEKDYLLKLFLFNYYKRFDEAVFKGGTCIKYFCGLERFSEDLDFNIKKPKKFQNEVQQTLKQIELIGIAIETKKEELFKEAYAAEFSFQGPLFSGSKNTLNKFRIDAGYRLGTLMEPQWQILSSEYPEMPKNFLIKAMNEQEMLAEKFLAIFERAKGRDLYDAWFLLKKGTKFDFKLFEKKAKKFGKKTAIDFNKIVSKKAYENDLTKLSKKFVPYKQIVKELKEAVGKN